MSLSAFQATVTVNSAIETSYGSGIWTLDLSIYDYEGVSTAYDMRIGDVVVLDTSSTDLGTLSRYTITSVTSRSVTGAVVVAQFDPTNNTSSPDISGYDTTQRGLLTRKTINRSLLNLPALSIQGLSDKFTSYLINYMNSDIVDNITGGSGGTTAATIVRRKASITNGTYTATVNIVASGSQADVNAIVVTQTSGNTVTLSNVSTTLFLQSITVRTPAGFNPTTSFQIRYPEPFGDTSALDMMAPFMMSYNEPGVIQATTLLNFSISAGVVQAQKTGLVANAAQIWRLQVM